MREERLFGRPADRAPSAPTADAEQKASSDEPKDPLRGQLLAAASRVFASKGYYGTKIMDIVREAGLSSGAIYGRFNSKNELLTAAVVSATLENAAAPPPDQIADFIARSTAGHRGPLTESEALQLEAFVAARREPEVADALAQARQRWRAAVQPFVQAALDDGTASPDIDVESLLYLLETLHLGLFLQRGAGMQPPEPEAWDAFIRRLVASMAGSPAPAPARRPTQRS
jgi:AcrR family transcriptional regulator